MDWSWISRLFNRILDWHDSLLGLSDLTNSHRISLRLTRLLSKTLGPHTISMDNPISPTLKYYKCTITLRGSFYTSWHHEWGNSLKTITIKWEYRLHDARDAINHSQWGALTPHSINIKTTYLPHLIDHSSVVGFQAPSYYHGGHKPPIH